MQQHQEQQYLDWIQHLLDNGVKRSDRTGTGTLADFGGRMEFDLSKGEFPLLTTKYVNMHGVMAELEWFLNGSDNAGELVRRSCNIWNEWMKPVKNFMGDECFHKRPIVMVNIDEVRSAHMKVVIPGLRGDESEDIVTDHYAQLLFEKEKVEAPAWIIDLWCRLLTQSFRTVYPDYFTGEDALLMDGIHGMVAEWFDIKTFIRDVQTLSNYDRIAMRSLNSEKYSTHRTYRLTTIYTLAKVVGPKTGDFLHRAEIERYREIERRGLLKINFKPKPYGAVTPMYLFDHNDVAVRIHESLSVARIDHKTAEQVGERRRLRYAKSFGDLGPIYGVQWRRRGSNEIDQLQQCIEMLKTDPYNRRIVVDAWNPEERTEMALPPCHMFYQFSMMPVDLTEKEQIDALDSVSATASISPKKEMHRLSLQFYMRSNDNFLGAPFNIASYAALLLKICAVIGALPGRVIMLTGDTHLYLNHIDQAKEQLSRKPYPLPTYSIGNWGADDPSKVEIHIHDYKYHPAIKAPVAV